MFRVISNQDSPKNLIYMSVIKHKLNCFMKSFLENYDINNHSTFHFWSLQSFIQVPYHCDFYSLYTISIVIVVFIACM